MDFPAPRSTGCPYSIKIHCIPKRTVAPHSGKRNAPHSESSPLIALQNGFYSRTAVLSISCTGSGGRERSGGNLSYYWHGRRIDHTPGRIRQGSRWHGHGLSTTGFIIQERNVVRLLGDLCCCARQALTRYFEVVTGSALTPGVIVVIQTFGDRINFHPHLHFLVTEGGVDEAGVFQRISSFDDDRLSFLEPEGKVGYRCGRDGVEQKKMDYLEFIARATSQILDKAKSLSVIMGCTPTPTGERSGRQA